MSIITMSTVSLEDLKPRKLSTEFGSEVTPEGRFEMKPILETDTQKPYVRLVKTTEYGTDNEILQLSVFYGHTEKDNRKYKGVNLNVGVAGTLANGADLSLVFRRYVVTLGIPAAEVQAATFDFTAADNPEELEAAGFKGIDTDVLMNGQSILSVIANATLRMEVKHKKNGRPYISGYEAIS